MSAPQDRARDRLGSPLFPWIAPLAVALAIGAAGCEGGLIGGGGRQDGGGVTLRDSGGPARDAGTPPGVDAGPRPDASTGTDAGPPPVPDAGPSCGAGEGFCDGRCVDLQNSNVHCGACGNRCGSGQACMAGACADLPACPPAPGDADAEGQAALALVNDVRQAMGIPCQRQVTEVNTAARLHCEYYDANRGNSMCIANAHAEVPGCMLFVAERFDQRMRAAGYTGGAAFENMHFVGRGASAVQGWIDSVWHRTPVLSPWIGEHGYGRASGCDTMDFGGSTGAPSDLIATYPYDGQTGVTTSFSGREGPAPPMPSTGWPSGYPIHIYGNGVTYSEHHLIVDATGAEVPHVWVTPADSTLLRREVVLYADDPLASATRYRVRAVGTRGGAPITVEFTFTTR